MQGPVVQISDNVADLALDHLICIKVFVRHGIDFCSFDHVSVKRAAKMRGIDPGVLAKELSLAIETAQHSQEHFPQLIPELADFIVTAHNKYFRNRLPFLSMLAEKVSLQDGAEHPRLYTLNTIIHLLVTKLIPHMDHEERTYRARHLQVQPTKESCSYKVDLICKEHGEILEILQQIQLHTQNFHSPSWACHRYQVLNSELQRMVIHIRKLIVLEDKFLLLQIPYA
jgi:regulator of cell morphogenesis and NO signaling